MWLDIQLFLSLSIQNIHKETRYSRLPQASEKCFCKTPNYLKNHYYKREECLESYESIALKLAEDDYAWFKILINQKVLNLEIPDHTNRNFFQNCYVVCVSIPLRSFVALLGHRFEKKNSFLVCQLFIFLLKVSVQTRLRTNF